MVKAFISPEFPNGADFSGMNGAHTLYISKVIHQTFVAVDENGTEAAGASVVLMGYGGGAPSGQPPGISGRPSLLVFHPRKRDGQHPVHGPGWRIRPPWRGPLRSEVARVGNDGKKRRTFAKTGVARK